MQQTLPWLGLAIVATVAYHVVFKLTPAGVNPFLSLFATYSLVALVCLGGVLDTGGATAGFDWPAEWSRLNWTAAALAVAIIGLDLGFLVLYRRGFEVSLAALVTQSAAAMILLVVGAALFRERLSTANALGIALCLAGLWLVNRR